VIDRIRTSCMAGEDPRGAVWGAQYDRSVMDQKPPRLSADDKTTLLVLLQYQRDSVVRKVSGVDGEQAQASPVGSGTSLLWLVNHVADAETTWILRRFAGRDVEDAAHSPDLDGAVARYQQVQRDVDAVIRDAASLDQECAQFDDQPTVNLRWVLAHLLEETARHAGHADILRELLDGATGR
jgi:uncharacterized damage-inducible protein DinB